MTQDSKKTKVNKEKKSSDKVSKTRTTKKVSEAKTNVKARKVSETKANVKARKSVTQKEKTISSRVKGRLEEFFENDVAPVLSKEFGYDNKMEVPTISQVTLNVGLGEAITDKNAIDAATKDLQLICGQKPVVTKSKKSIANFNLREGMRVGIKVTLRKARMWDFIDRLLNIALPRVRDFRGLSRNSFDGRGNYSLGISEQVIFPEIEYNQIDKIRGFQVTIGTTSVNDEEARRLLELLGMPFVRSNI